MMLKSVVKKRPQLAAEHKYHGKYEKNIYKQAFHFEIKYFNTKLRCVASSIKAHLFLCPNF